AYAPDGNTILAACRDSSVSRWDVSTGRKLRGFRMSPAKRPFIFPISISDDLKWIAFEDKDQYKTVHIWDVENEREALSFNFEGRYARQIGFSRDGGKLALCSADGPIYVWNLTNGNRLALLKDHKSMITA